MINIDLLPKFVKYNDNLYILHLGITAWNKIVVCYQYAFGPLEATEKKIEYSILSQVVEPNMTKGITYTKNITDIVDVPTTKSAFLILKKRIKQAIKNKVIKEYGNTQNRKS